MDTFEASNGVTVKRVGAGLYVEGEAVKLDRLREKLQAGSYGDVTPAAQDALREFFQHERDEELGRWRWPDDPRFLVYPLDDRGTSGSRRVNVFDECAGTMTRVLEKYRIGSTAEHEAADAYFEAHPEIMIPSEPRTAWVDKYGKDVWHVGTDGILRCVLSPSSDPRKYAPFTRLVPMSDQ